jgi:transcription-repair coupling factor (superfamily II helicase)
VLSKLGGKAWHALKARARHAVREMAGELLALYAARQAVPGIAYESDDELMRRLEDAFPYAETDDQARAIEAVKGDLESPRPMDRLICGDVGFGKTEVAVRAAMKVVTGGRQVLLLTPTTILAQQHLATFRDRFRDVPVRVELVSRFRKGAEVKGVVADFREGKVDILVGTHRVLSRDVVPNDLGLVIVDEEQRFGVAQKELLRQLRTEVDVLALSATPIPRSLHMSLAGLRDISVIATPPRGRRPIRTHVGEYDEEIVRQALMREHDRGGQSFVLHNRVESIDEAASRIQQLCPELRVAVGHGQMVERQLERVMEGFLRGDQEVLVATTIIEAGLDIPTANTLIVERADLLGLSQLYQIRGRVGRSDVHAHAYLFYPDAETLSTEARARLSALADHTELGSGFRIAMRDLELRGAGNLLGDEQSGHVAAVGFELYCELLAEAVAELQGLAQAAVGGPPAVRVDAQVDAFVPADYVGLESAKMDVHRRIALATTVDELRDVESELADRFGPLPDPVRNLVLLQEARLVLAPLGAVSLAITTQRATVGGVALSGSELRALRDALPAVRIDTARREVTHPIGGGTVQLEAGLDLAAAIIAVRSGAVAAVPS